MGGESTLRENVLVCADSWRPLFQLHAQGVFVKRAFRPR